MLNTDSALYMQIASLIEEQILRGLLREDEQAPSSNELSRAMRINPATAAKGLNLLAEKGVLYKKRGVGMFVAPGARGRILAGRRERFYGEYVRRLVAEARALEIDRAALLEMLARADRENGEESQ